MADGDYETFDLLIERRGEGYRARVLSSPVGQTNADLSGPISETDLDAFLFRVGRPRRTVRGGVISISEETRNFGTRLFRFLFPGPINDCLGRSVLAADARGAGLRIQIRLNNDVPELSDLPWELLYEEQKRTFIGLSGRTPIVRFLEVAEPVSPERIVHPLRILVVISSPTGLPALDVEKEWNKLREAVAEVEARGLVQLERLEVPRLPQLNRQLRRGEFHILHFVGHGAYNEEARMGEIYLENERGQAQSVTAERLATAVRDHRSLRLVILNACEGARSSRRDAFAGTAQALILSGVPAVVAMQFEVTDDAAITFASELYESIAIGDPIDRSVVEARRRIYLDGNELEWPRRCCISDPAILAYLRFLTRCWWTSG